MEGAPPGMEDSKKRHAERTGVVRRTTRMRSARLEWLIVGGGIHGTYLSHFLTKGIGVSPSSLRVLDPYDEPLASWRRVTENVGMEYLRSAAVHHLDLASLSLKRFLGPSGVAADVPKPQTIPPYGRPLLSLFNQHAAAVVEANGLDRLRVRGRANGLRPIDGGYAVDFDDEEAGTLEAQNVLLAIGMDDETCWPQWANALRATGAAVFHILDRGFHRRDLAPWSRAIVYGGGLSGAQVASALAAERPGRVTLLSGHEMEVHLFDSEPSWQGSNFMASFSAERSPEKRREIIARERHRGSLTPEAHAELGRLERRGDLEVVTVDPDRLSADVLPNRTLEVRTARGAFEGDLLILATGYDTRRPGGVWLDRAVERMSLPCAPCGFPIVAPNLEWRRGLFVSGPLAELELGPVSRNISGAHRTAARLEYYLYQRQAG